MNDKSKEPKIILCCSYFDLMNGPKQIAAIPAQNTQKILFVSEFFDFHQTNDFFTHIFYEQISFNKLFEIERVGARGGYRQFMITALVSLDLLRKKDLLQYYASINQMFDSWAKSFQKTNNINDLIEDGTKISSLDEIKPIVGKMQDFLEEFEYIISTMPEVVQIPMNKLL